MYSVSAAHHNATYVCVEGNNDSLKSISGYAKLKGNISGYARLLDNTSGYAKLLGNTVPACYKITTASMCVCIWIPVCVCVYGYQYIGRMKFKHGSSYQVTWMDCSTQWLT